MQSSAIKHYVIAGGGTAGWMTAALLGKLLAGTDASITLIESPEQPGVGVGEATVPSFVDFVKLLGIDEQAFVKATQATFKLGIQFSNWQTPGHSYWHPFGHVGARIDGKPFFQQWLHAHRHGLPHTYTDFSASARMAQENKFYMPNPQQPNNLSHMGYAYHFDAQRVAVFLRDFAVSKGVVHKQAHIEQIQTSANHSAIERLITRSGEHIDGDFFIDCTGTQARLMGQALNTEFIDWQRYLPVDRAWVVQTENTDEPVPYTKAIAEPMGWRWQIPLQHRTGNGLVFCSQYTSPDEAKRYLQTQLTKPLLNEPRLLTFKTGHLNQFWRSNCVAIGLSAGFLEPLESTGIYLIMRGILNLAKLLPSSPPCEATIQEYNQLMLAEYQHIRDFIVLHYCLSQRCDSPFWQSWQQRDIPTSLTHKLALYRTRGVVSHAQSDLFADHSWHAVTTGMGLLPSNIDPTVSAVSPHQLIELLSRMDTSFSHSVNQLLTHGAYIHEFAS
ncbi:tryptophan halogenase family protein [Alteromonas sp. AMM-1]|uniref:tryptophan halogenase family protein n=1 Tax=Alteromonas sp. AMM-1 TaxID=3394233 RepID=UPI0039A74409